MRAVILLGTLKKDQPSNTEALSEFLVEKMRVRGIESEIVKLVDHTILPGTYSAMGEGDRWPGILEKLTGSDIVIFATPVWWGGHSSEIQRVIERLDELHDEIMQGKESRFEGKLGGIVITGDSDGAQHIIANIANFFNAIGIVLPPHASLSVLWEGHAKGKERPKKELLEKYEKDYSSVADKMIDQWLRYSSTEIGKAQKGS
jgi:multimeric flavodoxin WrbA